ncbi:hypothetical protein [Aliikangiella sp. IMCC44359]|uniref:hypothetical protein n=1 Tax=Aliikangiella sp. IMCC44359 TaxID=3459125 RepID=UPI00403AA3C2
MKNYIFITYSIAILSLISCQQNTSQPKNALAEESTNNIDKKNMIQSPTYKGTIKHFSHEGGFFGIVTNQGKKLLPLNLDKKFKQDGAIIEFSGHINEDVMTIQQWGKPFEIKEIMIIKKGKLIENPDL